mmetsp:Transcript_5892/g.13073  ORF Transcript_5892/g.13073 Transcript_5892/m.13073 type:complete len:197 (+) Transcript_5892:1-591(+)
MQENVEHLTQLMTTVADDSDPEEDEDVQVNERSPSQQQREVILGSLWRLAVGGTLVYTISLPVTECIVEIAKRVGVAPYYAGFVLAPWASNASEFAQVTHYAAQRSSESISIALGSLAASACINNTLCLGIYLAAHVQEMATGRLIAEALSVVVVEMAVGYLSAKRVHRLVDALTILSLYPASLAFAAVFNYLFWS